MKERRKSVRVNFPFCILYSHIDSAREIPGVAKDISVDGAKVVLDTAIDILPGSSVSLSILLPETALDICGKVVWERNVGKKREIGVCFERVSKQIQEDIYHYIFRYIRQEKDIARQA